MYATIKGVKVLVTGVNGFVGKHLVRELKKRGNEVIGVGREASPAPEIKELLTDYWACDLMDKEAVAKLSLKDIDAAVSLAGLARVGDSFSDPGKYKTINIGVLRNLCQVLIDKNLKPRVIAVSTGTVYDPEQPMPLSETSKITKVGSPYTISKILMEQAARAFREQGLEMVIVRPFNHLGPGQEKGFLVPDLFAKLQAAKSSKSVIKVGNLSTKRDYTDVRDVVRAYADLVLAKQLGYDTYNICSGQSLAGQEILDLLSNLAGTVVKVKIDPALLRPNEITDIFGSYKRLREETGWQSKIPLQKTLADFVNSSN